mgnify:CR=1 FL=1
MIALGAVVAVADRDGRLRLADVVAVTQRAEGTVYAVTLHGQQRERAVPASEVYVLVPAVKPEGAA